MSDYVYLDHAASAPVRYFAKDYYIPANPNSPHALGLQANQTLNEARQRIIDCLGVKSGKVLVGGTASQLIHYIMERIELLYTNYYICGSYYEHDCIEEYLQGHCDYDDMKDIEEWKEPNTVVCWMMTNNITGEIFPVEQIGKMCRNAGAYYIMDAVAAVGHYPISDNLESFCDCLITSAHKYGGPQGAGCMWVSDRFAKFLGLSDDAHEEYGLIHGTPNVSAAIAMSYAMEHAIDEAWVMEAKTQNLVFYLQRMLEENNIECHIVCDDQPKTYAINALYLPKFNADALVNFLSSKGIYISPGHSACSNDAADATRVLEAFGLTKEQASQTVRISFGEDTTEEDIDALVNGIVEFKEMFV